MDLKEVGCDVRNWKDLAQDKDQMTETPGSLKTNYSKIKGVAFYLQETRVPVIPGIPWTR